MCECVNLSVNSLSYSLFTVDYYTMASSMSCAKLDCNEETEDCRCSQCMCCTPCRNGCSCIRYQWTLNSAQHILGICYWDLNSFITLQYRSNKDDQEVIENILGLTEKSDFTYGWIIFYHRVAIYWIWYILNIFIIKHNFQRCLAEAIALSSSDEDEVIVSDAEERET